MTPEERRRYQKQWRANNPEKVKEQIRKYLSNPISREKARIATKKWRLSHPRKGITFKKKITQDHRNEVRRLNNIPSYYTANRSQRRDERYYVLLKLNNPEKWERMKAIVNESLAIQRKEILNNFYWLKLPPYIPGAYDRELSQIYRAFKYSEIPPIDKTNRMFKNKRRYIKGA